jgi:uncharacterized protein YbaR (Trm112 family)
MTSSTSELDPIALGLIACPACDDRPKVSLNAERALVCEGCKREFSIIGGIPRMVVEASSPQE